VADFQDLVIFHKNVVWDQLLMDVTSLMNIIQPNSYLQNTIQNPFGVQVLVLVHKKPFRDPISERPSLQLLHKDKLLTLSDFHLKRLSHMHMIPDVNPLPDPFPKQLLFLFISDFLA